jgi:hypothetical protein
MAGIESAAWHAKKTALVRAVRQATKPNGEVAWTKVQDRVGFTAHACRLKWGHLTSLAKVEGVTPEELAARQAPTPSPTDSPTDLTDLAPIRMPAPTRNPALRSTPNVTVVAGDFHFGEDTHSPECEEILLSVCEDLQPGTVVLNGDLPDLMAVSRYPKDYRTNNKLSTEKRQFWEFLHRLVSACPATRLVETNANHSGQGIESRWSRYLSERVPELMEDPAIRASLSYQAVFHPPWAAITLVDYHVICPGFIAIHGDIVRSHAAYSARAMLEKWRVSLIHGHCHRVGHYGYRVPAVAEKREHQMRAWEGGCMCRLTAPYLSVANWQQGFSVVRHTDDGWFGVEQVLIHEGQAVCTTTGQSYRASA